jgi:hypothetical protein
MQVPIEGKSASKVLKTQSDAVVTMGTKAKMASAGMAMYQDRQSKAFAPARPRRQISLTTASFFYSCNIPARNADAPVFREMVQASIASGERCESAAEKRSEQRTTAYIHEAPSASYGCPSPNST